MADKDEHEIVEEELNNDELGTLKDLLARIGLQDVDDANSVEDLKDLLPLKPKAKKKPKRAPIEDDEDDDDEPYVRSMTMPKLTWFSGAQQPPKGHVSFDAWKLEVEGLLDLYDEKMVRHAMKRSLRSPAIDHVQAMHTDSTCQQILAALEVRFGEVSELNHLVSELHSTKQGEKESLTEFTSRLERLVFHIGKLDPKFEDVDETLRQNFFRGLRSDRIREALRTPFELNHFANFDHLLKSARKLSVDLDSRHSSRATMHQQVALQEPNSDREWLREELSKFKDEMVQMQMATAQPQDQSFGQGYYRGRGHDGGRGQNRGRGHGRGRGQGRGGYQGGYHQGPSQEPSGYQGGYQRGPGQGHGGYRGGYQRGRGHQHGNFQGGPHGGYGPAQDPDNVQCFRCLRYGHYRQGCPYPPANPNGAGSGQEDQN